MRLARPDRSNFCRLVLAACLIGVGATALAAAWPGKLQGSWDVVQVAVDHDDQPHWQYFPDDPRLLGRELDIGSTSLVLNDDSRACPAPAPSALPNGTLQHFLGQQFPRPEGFETAKNPSLADFGLGIADTAVSPLRMRCTPDNSPWNGAWLVLLPDDRLLTNYDNSGYVLVLRRRSESEPAKPSFACAKVHGDTEKAICGSAGLAGYDRSVTAAYRRAMGTTDDAASLKQDQVAWIKTRNACGGDAACLEKSMRDRVDQLMQQ